MQKQTITVFILFFCFSSFAELPSYNFSIESLLNNTNSELESKCQESNEQINQYQECLVSICGDPKDYTTLLDEYILNIGNTVESKDDSRKLLEDSINKFYDLESSTNTFDNEDEMKTLIKKVLLNIDAVKPGKQLNIIPFIQLAEATTDIVQYNEEKKEYEIKQEKIDKYSNSENDKKNLTKVANEYKKIILNLTSQLQYSEIDPLGTFVNLSSGTELSKDEKLISVINDMKIKILELNKILPVEVFSRLYKIEDLDSFIQKIKLGTIMEIDLKSLITKYQYSELFLLYAREIKENIDYYNSKTKDEAKGWLFKKNIDEVASEILILGKKTDSENQKTTKEDREHAIDKCMNSFDRNISQLPKDKEIKKFSADVEQYRNKFINNIPLLKSVSQTTRANLAKEVSKLKFGLPFSREDWKKNLIKRVQTAVSKKRIGAELSNSTSIKELQVLYLLHKLKNNSSEAEEDDEEETSDLGDICDELEQETFADKTYTGFGKIVLSYTMVNASNYYKEGVIFHEIAHNVEKFLRNTTLTSDVSTTSFSNLSSCLEGVQNSIGITESDHFFSEDFADYIAMKLSNNKDKSYMCEYLQANQTSKKYFANSIFNENKDDTHSSTLFRVIRNTIDKFGKTSKSCTKALHSEGVTLIPSSCSF